MGESNEGNNTEIWEEIEERIHIGADGLEVTYCFVDCKVTECIKQEISCYQSQHLDMCI
jgi:hypothetical protein